MKMQCPTKMIPQSCIPLVLFVLAVTPLAGALLSQYGFGLSPCHLCILQRIPYAAVMGVAVIAALVAKKSPCMLKALLMLAAMIFFADAVLAFFHTGVERQWWQKTSWWSSVAKPLGLESCSGAAAADSVDALRAMLQNAPIARCDQPAFMFLGLSMASWNGIYALFATVFTLKLGACHKPKRTCCPGHEPAEKTDAKSE